MAYTILKEPESNEHTCACSSPCSHLGDARATDMSFRRGEHNVGQLLREQFGAGAVFNIGFSTHTGEWRYASLDLCTLM